MMDIVIVSWIGVLFVSTLILHTRTNRLLDIVASLTKDKVSLTKDKVSHFDLRMELEALKQELRDKAK